MERRADSKTHAGRLALVMLAAGLIMQAACTSTLSSEEQSAHTELGRHFPAWTLVVDKDLTDEDLSLWSADHPDLEPGFSSGDYFGDGRTAFSAILTQVDEEQGRRVRLVILSQTESGRYESYPIFSESPVEKMPAIFTSPAGQYQVFVDDEEVLLPNEGVVYTHPGASEKLFYWNGSQFIDVELGN